MNVINHCVWYVVIEIRIKNDLSKFSFSFLHSLIRVSIDVLIYVYLHIFSNYSIARQCMKNIK
jgi:Zn-dependent M32 family carboxypeptidase